MAEYIEREALLNSRFWAKLKNDFDAVRARVIINSIPSADVVEVVKCKNCVFSKYIEDSGNYKCTSFNGRFGIVKAEDFCSYGERRSDE
jgi:hypothetical protein